MGLTDYTANNKCKWETAQSICPYNLKTTRNHICELIGHICGLLFTIEACIKILASGFIFGKNAFLTDSENLRDFIVVVAWLIEVFLQYGPINAAFINLNMLRILRILRPLRAMKTIPSLRKQI